MRPVMEKHPRTCAAHIHISWEGKSPISSETALGMNHGIWFLNNNLSNLFKAVKMGHCSKLSKTYLFRGMCVSTTACLVRCVKIKPISCRWQRPHFNTGQLMSNDRFSNKCSQHRLIGKTCLCQHLFCKTSKQIHTQIKSLQFPD